ncbi:hypothetical protein BC828DRAFT_378948 [Blastocladiella britannica]|nr:hypothetical protein BC828DRAFT_378948 [Blastocladiella britannica]
MKVSDSKCEFLQQKYKMEAILPVESVMSTSMARNSYITFSILLVISTGSILRASRAIHPTPFRWIECLVTGQDYKPRKRSRRPIPRDWLLLTSAFLLFVDALNRLLVCINYRQNGNANFFLYRIVDAISQQTVVFLVTAAIVDRCFVIVLANTERLRNRFLWVFKLLCAAVCIEHKWIYLSWVVTMRQQDASPYTWIYGHAIPQWMLLELGILPVIIIVATAGSISVAFCQPLVSFEARQPSTLQDLKPPLVASQPAIMGTGNGTLLRGTTATINSGQPALVRRESLASVLVKKSLFATLTKPGGSRSNISGDKPLPERGAQDMQTSGSIGADSASLGSTKTTTGPSTLGKKSIQVPLTRSFIALSCFMIFAYTVFMSVVLTVEGSIPILPGFWLGTVLNVVLVAEMAFDRLLRWNRVHGRTSNSA